MTEPQFIIVWREQLEARLQRVRGRRQDAVRSALATIPTLQAYIVDPTCARAVEVALSIRDALPARRPCGVPFRAKTGDLSAIASKTPSARRPAGALSEASLSTTPGAAT